MAKSNLFTHIQQLTTPVSRSARRSGDRAVLFADSPSFVASCDLIVWVGTEGLLRFCKYIKNDNNI